MWYLYTNTLYINSCLSLSRWLPVVTAWDEQHNHTSQPSATEPFWSSPHKGWKNSTMTLSNKEEKAFLANQAYFLKPPAKFWTNKRKNCKEMHEAALKPEIKVEGYARYDRVLIWKFCRHPELFTLKGTFQDFMQIRQCFDNWIPGEMKRPAWIQ